MGSSAAGSASDVRRAAIGALAAVVVSAPWLVAALVPRQQRYVLHVLIFTALFAALALSYDLVVGHVGSLSLAHPAFFGVGAYTAAILATRARWPFLADLLAAVLVAAAVAALVGVPLFRLAEHAFAVGTLGLARAAGIDPLKYRLLAFTIGAALAGGIGALYVHYLSVMCPEEMTVALTVNLLVIVFLGGVGSLRGVLLGAVLFTALPEVLRLAPTWRLVIYGALLLLVVVRSPEGIESLLRRATGARAGR